MAVRDILIWPDDRLRQVSTPVTAVDAEIRNLVEDLLETMYAAGNGVGLAAPQVGVHKRVVVIDLQGKRGRPGDQPPLVLINPVITAKDGEMLWEEGCLSLPDETGKVTRASRCTAEFTDLEGTPRRVVAEGLAAVAIQHETDHLDGKVFVDYLGPIKRNVIKRRMVRLKQERATRNGRAPASP